MSRCLHPDVPDDECKLMVDELAECDDGHCEVKHLVDEIFRPNRLMERLRILSAGTP